MLCCQVTKSNTNPDELGGLANQLTTEFGDLASEARCAAMTAENDEVSSHTVHFSADFVAFPHVIIHMKLI